MYKARKRFPKFKSKKASKHRKTRCHPADEQTEQVEKKNIFVRFYLFLFQAFTSFLKAPSSKSVKLEDDGLQYLLKRLDFLENKVAKLSSQVKKLEARQPSKDHSLSVTQSSIHLNSSHPVAPPPPPPPPPPVPPTVASATQMHVNNKTSLSMKDLLGVKLKKRDLASENNKNHPQAQMITLKDLQNIKLKSGRSNAKQKSDMNQNYASPKVMTLKTLRKTNLVRSPGGTPMVKRDVEHTTADGITPAFTKALRNKFKSLQSSPNQSESSPGRWRC